MSKVYSRAKQIWKNSWILKSIVNRINHRYRKRLTNDEFTILCSNCIGGCIYHRLGKRFLSPTINMWMTQPDFVTFLLHLDDYLKAPLQFVLNGDTTPCGKVGGGYSS